MPEEKKKADISPMSGQEFDFSKGPGLLLSYGMTIAFLVFVFICLGWFYGKVF
jgi:hypothetical protein